MAGGGDGDFEAWKSSMVRSLEYAEATSLWVEQNKALRQLIELEQATDEEYALWYDPTQSLEPGLADKMIKGAQVRLEDEKKKIASIQARVRYFEMKHPLMWKYRTTDDAGLRKLYEEKDARKPRCYRPGTMHNPIVLDDSPPRTPAPKGTMKASSAPKGTMKASAAPKGTMKASSAPRGTMKASSAPKGDPNPKTATRSPPAREGAGDGASPEGKKPKRLGAADTYGSLSSDSEGDAPATGENSHTVEEVVDEILEWLGDEEQRKLDPQVHAVWKSMAETSLEPSLDVWKETIYHILGTEPALGFLLVNPRLVDMQDLDELLFTRMGMRERGNESKRIKLYYYKAALILLQRSYGTTHTRIKMELANVLRKIPPNARLEKKDIKALLEALKYKRTPPTRRRKKNDYTEEQVIEKILQWLTPDGEIQALSEELDAIYAGMRSEGSGLAYAFFNAAVGHVLDKDNVRELSALNVDFLLNDLDNLYDNLLKSMGLEKPLDSLSALALGEAVDVMEGPYYKGALILLRGLYGSDTQRIKETLAKFLDTMVYDRRNPGRRQRMRQFLTQ